MGKRGQGGAVERDQPVFKHVVPIQTSVPAPKMFLTFPKVFQLGLKTPTHLPTGGKIPPWGHPTRSPLGEYLAAHVDDRTEERVRTHTSLSGKPYPGVFKIPNSPADRLLLTSLLFEETIHAQSRRAFCKQVNFLSECTWTSASISDRVSNTPKASPGSGVKQTRASSPVPVPVPAHTPAIQTPLPSGRPVVFDWDLTMYCGFVDLFEPCRYRLGCSGAAEPLGPVGPSVWDHIYLSLRAAFPRLVDDKSFKAVVLSASGASRKKRRPSDHPSAWCATNSPTSSAKCSSYTIILYNLILPAEVHAPLRDWIALRLDEELCLADIAGMGPGKIPNILHQICIGTDCLDPCGTGIYANMRCPFADKCVKVCELRRGDGERRVCLAAADSRSCKCPKVPARRPCLPFAIVDGSGKIVAFPSSAPCSFESFSIVAGLETFGRPCVETASLTGPVFKMTVGEARGSDPRSLQTPGQEASPGSGKFWLFEDSDISVKLRTQGRFLPRPTQAEGSSANFPSSRLFQSMNHRGALAWRRFLEATGNGSSSRASFGRSIKVGTRSWTIFHPTPKCRGALVAVLKIAMGASVKCENLRMTGERNIIQGYTVKQTAECRDISSNQSKRGRAGAKPRSSHLSNRTKFSVWFSGPLGSHPLHGRLNWTCTDSECKKECERREKRERKNTGEGESGKDKARSRGNGMKIPLDLIEVLDAAMQN